MERLRILFLVLLEEEKRNLNVSQEKEMKLRGKTSEGDMVIGIKIW